MVNLSVEEAMSVIIEAMHEERKSIIDIVKEMKLHDSLDGSCNTRENYNKALDDVINRIESIL